MEAEIRLILTAAANEDDEPADLFMTLVDRFGRLGGADLELPARATPPRAAELPE
ncbi:hypothetical protein [Cryptosporangium aurantiacum]